MQYQVGLAVQIWAWTVEIAGHVVSRSRSGERTACESRKQQSHRKAPVPFGALVTFMPVDKPKDKGEVRNRVLATCLVSWTDLTKSSLARPNGWSKLVLFIARLQGSEAMPRTRRASEAYRGNRIQPRWLKESHWAWPKLAFLVFPMVAVEHRPAVPVMEPRDYKARRSHMRREVELAKYGFSDYCEGRRLAQVGAEAKPHSEGCRAHQTSDDERRRGPAACGGAASLAGRRTTVCGNKSRSGPDEAMRHAPAASSAREASVAEKRLTQKGREQPNGGRCTLETRGSEEVGLRDDPGLTPVDESQMEASARWQ